MSTSELPAPHAVDGVPSFPFPAAAPYAPPDEFAELRDRCPVSRVRLPTGDTAWLVTRYADNRAVLADPRFSRAAAARQNAPRARLIPLDDRAITALDPPEHTALRRVVTPAFTTGRIRRLEPFVRAEAGRLVRELAEAGAPGDFVTAVAAPFALNVVGRLLGVPAIEHERLRALTDAYLGVDSHTPDQMRAAVSTLKALLGEQVARHRAHPGDELIDVLIAGGLAEETIVTFGVTLLVAGYETVVAHLTNSLLVLLRHPDQLELVRRNPAALPAAVEELLRFTAISPAGGTLRVAVQDVTLGGATIRAGEAVQPSTVAANHDPAVFAEPHRLDVTRDDSRHIAFGHGVHHCLGAGLARLELRAALAEVLRRLPHVRLAVPEETLGWNRRKMIRGMRTLPLEW